MKFHDVLQALGAAAVTVGVGLVSVPAAVMIAGVLLLIFGVAMERG